MLDRLFFTPLEVEGVPQVVVHLSELRVEHQRLLPLIDGRVDLLRTGIAGRW